MAIWGQTVTWKGPSTPLRDFTPVRILYHPLDPGYYAVFARLVVIAQITDVGIPSVVSTPFHSVHAQLSLGSATDESVTRLECEIPGSGDQAIQKTAPVSLQTVGKSGDGEGGGIDLIVRGNGTLVVETGINIISLDEMRDPGHYEGSYDLADREAPGLHLRDFSHDVWVPHFTPLHVR